MDTSGVLTTLTLPSGVLMDSTKRIRSTIFGRYAVLVNAFTRPITVSTEGVVRVLCPRPPRTVPTLAGASGGSLSGTFRVWQSFLIFDDDGNLLAESDLGPESAAATISSQYLQASTLDRSPDDVSASRLYRTTTNGSVPFPWIDLDGNAQTSILDDLADLGLQTVSAPTLGSPPDLTLISEFKERLWGVSRTAIDILRYTEAQTMSAWPDSRALLVPREGGDDRGITGIIPRNDNIIIGRQNRLFQIAGDDPVSFRVVQLKEEIGIEAIDSIVTDKETTYFLAKDGVYAMGDASFDNVCEGKTRKWFNSDTYFNRARLRYAVGRLVPDSRKYQLLLSAAGSSNLDRWVELDIPSNTWWGPHKTDDFTPTWMATILDANENPLPIICSSTGFVYKDQATRTDGTATGIDFDVDEKFHDCDTPDIEKFFGRMALISKVQAAGTLTITPKIGGLDASTGTAISADMTLGRETLPNLSESSVPGGRMVQLNFRHTTAGQDVELYGYEVEWHELGRR